METSVLKLLYKSDFYELHADKEEELIIAKWLRSVSKQEMITGGTKLHDVIQETGFTRVLADAKNLDKLDHETKEWMSTRFYELLSQTPLKKIARVLPDNLFYQLALESVATRAEALGLVKFQYRNFSNIEEARIWLNN